MNLQDLKLLVDVAYHERDGQHGAVVGTGLVAGSLIIRNPSQPKDTAQVTITPAGLKTVDALVGRLESAAIVAAVGEFL